MRMLGKITDVSNGEEREIRKVVDYPVKRFVDAKVYVYDADGNYQSDRDFDLATGNTTAQGIAWDGAYFYVVDIVDDKVHVYDADGTHVG